MKLILEGKEITLQELKEIIANLKICPADGGDFEIIAIDEITEDAIHFEICGYSTF